MSDPAAGERHGFELEAAMELWEFLAAFAWDRCVTFGAGVVLLERDDLIAARDAQRSGQEPELVVTPGYVPLTHIPPGDDFRALVRTLDPRRQIALLVRRDPQAADEGAEHLYVLEMIEGKRAASEECYFAREGRR